MRIKVFLTASFSILMVKAEKTTNGQFQLNLSKLSVPSNLSDFFSSWRINSEKMHDIKIESQVRNSTVDSENRQKQKELESKLNALQDLYDINNWEIQENEHFTDHAQNARQMPETLYDSLLTRRTFMPSFKTILIELSLMTLSIVAVNAIENAMAQTKKPSKIKKNGYHRLYSNHADPYNKLTYS